jgi:putative intracellular protease/amidase
VAGYEVEFATGTGFGMAFEEWSWEGPKHNGGEKELRELFDRLKPKWDMPLSTAAALVKLDTYKAIFFPGGHGTMIEMHAPKDDDATKQILHAAHAKQLPTVTICHGPHVVPTRTRMPGTSLWPSPTPQTAA